MSIILLVLFLCSGMISGCEFASGSEPTRIMGSRSNPNTESTPSAFDYPKANRFVNDFAGVLTLDEANRLEEGLRDLQKRGKIDFAIAIVRSTNGKDIFDYSLGMAKEWKVGSENGGILLVVAIVDRKWQIQINKKLEKEFTAAETKAIGDTMIPHFREQKYGDGLTACLKTFVGELARKYNFEPISF